MYENTILLAEVDALERADTQKIIEAAMGMLRIRHQVDEASAYAILVQRSIESQESIRATAVRTLAHSGWIQESG